MVDNTVHQPVWCIQTPDDVYDAEETAQGKLHYNRVMNDGEYSRERIEKFRRMGLTPLFPRTMRFDTFVNLPWLSMVAYHRFDLYSHADTFVSPKLFALLDQPPGSLQGLPTRTDWKHGEPPGWSYVWLSYIPTVPAMDLERSKVEVLWKTQNGQPVQRIGNREGPLVLRQDLVPPCGLFLAAEEPSTLLVTDTVAAAVLQAGCTGIEFVEVETAYSRYGALRRRGLNGVELRPSGVESRQKNRIPVPDA